VVPINVGMTHDSHAFLHFALMNQSLDTTRIQF